MRGIRRVIFLVPMLMLLLLLSACGGSKRYELSRDIGKSVATFERKSGLKLEKQSNGIYLQADTVQVMAPNKKVTSVILLKNAGIYKVFGVSIGMKKTDADKLLYDTFGKEITKTENTDHTVTYSYLNNTKELYITYDAENEAVVGLSYYVDKGSKKNAISAKANSGELMMIVGDTKVYYNEAMVYLKQVQEDYEKDYGSKIWNADILGQEKSFGTMMKDEVTKQITELKVIRCEAAKLGITLSEDEVAEADSYAKDRYDKMSKQDKSKYLITQELLQQVYSDNLLANKVFENLTINVDTDVPDAQAKQITVQDILIYSTQKDSKGKRVPLTAEEKDAAFEKVTSLHDQAKTTKDFYSLAEANTQADTIEYTFGKGGAPKDYGDAFEQAAMGLKTGEISDVITTDYGWHILYCVSDYNEDATTQVKENIIEKRRNKLFADYYKKWVKDYEVVVNKEAWDSIALED